MPPHESRPLRWKIWIWLAKWLSIIFMWQWCWNLSFLRDDETRVQTSRQRSDATSFFFIWLSNIIEVYLIFWFNDSDRWHETLALKCTHMLATWGLWLLEDWGFVSVVQWAIGILHLWDQWNQKQHPQHQKKQFWQPGYPKGTQQKTHTKGKTAKEPQQCWPTHTHTPNMFVS